MAKIEIYETENDVKRERLKETKRRTGSFLSFSMDGLIFSSGAFVTSKLIDWFSSKDSRWRHNNKEVKAASALMAGFFGIGALVSYYYNNKSEQLLDKLGEGKEHVIVPNNLSTEALGQIPIGSVDTFTLHKTAPDRIKSHTERVLQDVGAETARTP